MITRSLWWGFVCRSADLESGVPWVCFLLNYPLLKLVFTGRADAVGELGTFFVVVFIFGFEFVFVINVKIIYKN